jgi:ATP-dependent Lon protease
MWVGLHNYIDSEFADLKTMKKSSLKETVLRTYLDSLALQLSLSKKYTRHF